MPVDALIAHSGYAAVLVGTFLEGETVLVLAGIAAHRGYLDLPLVIGAAFLDTLFGDQLYFFLGRRHAGPAAEEKAVNRKMIS
jgi:membrane protein DedA with SNARE-associated domain